MEPPSWQKQPADLSWASFSSALDRPNRQAMLVFTAPTPTREVTVDGVPVGDAMQLTILSQDEVRAIHQATLQILSEVGVFLDDDEAGALLFDHGAREHYGRVCLPPHLVEACLER